MRKSITKIAVVAACLLMIGASLNGCQSTTPATQSSTQMSNAAGSQQHQVQNNRDIGNGAYGESVP